MRIGSCGLVVVALITSHVSAQTSPTSQFRLELRFPNGGSSMSLLDLRRVVTSGSTETYVRVDQAGTSVYKAFLVSEFEAVSIRANSVVLRFRLRRFEGMGGPDELMKQWSISDIREVMDAAKVPWQTMAYIPGELDEIPFDGAVVKVTGSVVSK
ncbi:MAG: hypothetical protein WBC78_22340 [Candidatus Sulfotelmatobacter sp.]